MCTLSWPWPVITIFFKLRCIVITVFPLLGVFRPKYRLYIIQPFSTPSPPPTRNTPSGCSTNLFVKTCLASAPYIPPCLPPSPAAGHHRSSSGTASQHREIEMLRAGTTAPLIKFPRLIPADPLIALSHQALQGDRGQRPGGTTNKHSTLTMGTENSKPKQKKEAECGNEKPEMAHKVGVV